MDALELIVWILIGGTIGWVANLVFAPELPEPPGVQIIVGALGAFIGGYVVDAFERGRPGGGHAFVSYLIAPIAAVAMVGLWRLVSRDTDSIGGTS